MPYIGDVYIYGFNEVCALLKSYFLDEIGGFDLADKKADIHSALNYYGLTRKDCIKTVRKKNCGIECCYTVVKYRAVGLICEFLNGNLALLDDERAKRIAKSYTTDMIKETLFV